MDKSAKDFYKVLTEKNIDNHSQVKLAYLYAKRLKIFVNKFLKKKITLLDCGCGFGFIAQELQKITNL